MEKNPNYLKDQDFPFPIIFRFEAFLGKKHFLEMAYFLGIGINSVQLENLMLDFFNLYLVSMYILYFRNPIFEKDMKKVFWKYPLPSDTPKEWNRVEDSVKKYITYILDPIPLTDKKYKKLRDERKFSEEEMLNNQIKYQNYVDM
jgi:hypothetical protein